jgi:capsular polysaccharide biosynthesis protein
VSVLDADPLYAQAAVDSVIDAVIEVTEQEGAFPVLTNKIRRTSFATTAEYASPNRLLITIIGATFGAFASVGFVIMNEFFSTSFKSKEEIEKTLNLQIIGIIPQMDMKVIKTNGKK